jgi:GTP cyclohydrolase IA
MNQSLSNKPIALTGDKTDADMAEAAKPSREQAEEAVRTLLLWAGENPDREGLIDTPSRVVKSYNELFAGYAQDPIKVLETTFDEAGGYDEVIALTNIEFNSHCEHHMLPVIGRAHIAYLPNHRVIGLSKLARLVDVFANRLQIQERMTAQVADTLQEVLKPRGVAVVIEAHHQCMSMRGVKKSNGMMKTSRMLGAFRDDPETRREFLSLIERSAT